MKDISDPIENGTVCVITPPPDLNESHCGLL